MFFSHSQSLVARCCALLVDSCLRGQVVNMVESFNVTELDGNDGVVYTWELAVSLAGWSQ
jgi:hypothetical protein